MSSDARALEDLKIDHRAKDGGRLPAWVWLVLILLVAVAVGGWLWTKAPRAIDVKTVTVEAPRAGSGSDAVLNASGYVTARRRATVSSKVTARVTEVHVEEGMAVKKGQVLARLDTTTADRYLALAQAELESTRRAVYENKVRLDQARLTFGRMTALRKEGVVNQADVDAAQTEVSALEARLALSEEQVKVSERQVAVRQNDLADLTITAPFEGVAISKDAQPGEMISPVSAGGGFTRTGICTVVDMSSLEIEVDVNETYIHRVTPGQRVEATLDAYPEWHIPAKVITMVPTADRQKATVLVRIAFDQLDPKILPDMGVKVAFLGAQLPVPAAAPPITIAKGVVRTDGGNSVVFIVGRDGLVERRAIRVGPAKEDRVTVTAGLSPGETVVLDPPPTLKAGDRVAIVK